MAKKHKPRSGSLAFYPRKRALRETPSFSSTPTVTVAEGETSKPITFLGYKVGMTHILGKDAHEKGATAGQEVNIPVTVIETPPLKVFGIRAYAKSDKSYGLAASFDVLAEKPDKSLLKKITNFKKKSGKKDKKETTKAKTLSDLDAAKEKLVSIVLLAHTQPGLCGFGKKRPDIMEVTLSGNVEQQITYAKEVLGKDVVIGDAFDELEFIDVKAVDKGKGMQGVVKRFGVKVHRPKAKKRRVVGSIGPWNPSTVMWTVARPGQMGYQTRTECNKKILRLGENGEGINPASGFTKYGVVKNNYVILAGSIPGPSKRVIALRKHNRKLPGEKHKIEGIDFIATRPETGKNLATDEKLLHKVEIEKEKKVEKKSVADEIQAAVKGEKK